MEDRDSTNVDPEMIWRKPWEFLRSGDFEQGLRILREEYEAKPRFRARETLRLGIGYMWAEMYDSAAAHFTAAAHAEFNSEAEFAFAGVAEWHRGNMKVAIERWREGLKAQYAVGCRVCNMTARLLVVASAFEPDRIPKQEAVRTLRDAMGRLDPSKVPGVWGRFLLGEVEANEVEPLWVGNIAPGVKGVLPHRKWLSGFYGEARRLIRAEIDVAEFRALMCPMVGVAGSKSADIGTFINVLRNPEYFFARTEAAKSC